jgi:Flp pilus assembly protein TadG
MNYMKSFLQYKQKKYRSGERGSNVVEFALTVPVILLMFMAIFDLGRAFYLSHALSEFAREGGRYAIVHPTDTSVIAQYIRNHAAGVDPDDLNITITFPSTNWVHVLVTYDYYPATPLITQFLGDNDHITLDSSTEMQIER